MPVFAKKKDIRRLNISVKQSCRVQGTHTVEKFYGKAYSLRLPKTVIAAGMTRAFFMAASSSRKPYIFIPCGITSAIEVIVIVLSLRLPSMCTRVPANGAMVCGLAASV
jgi:hypothetical protein